MYTTAAVVRAVFVVLYKYFRGFSEAVYPFQSVLKAATIDHR